MRFAGMTDEKISTIERRYQVRGINSESGDLWYLLEDGVPEVGIVTRNGGIRFSLRQARALCRELPGILEGMRQ